MIVLNLILIGLVITLEPLPLTAFILVLSSKGGVRKGAAFIFGWLLSLAIVIAFTVLVTGNKPPKPSTAPSLAALAAKLAIGVGLTVIAIRPQIEVRGAGLAGVHGDRTVRAVRVAAPAGEDGGRGRARSPRRRRTRVRAATARGRVTRPHPPKRGGRPVPTPSSPIRTFPIPRTSGRLIEPGPTAACRAS